MKLISRIGILFLLLVSASCSKESNLDPVFNSFPLIGTWISSTGTPIMTIENLNDQGSTEKYLEYTEGGSRFLRRTYHDFPTTYEIIYLDRQELRLVTRSGESLKLYRVPDKKN